MSREIDERIVDMQFNNGEFEKGIQESLKSLEALKKGLELDKSAKNLDSLSKALSHVDFSSMAKGIETISSRFTTLGIVGMRALQNITDKVMAMGEKMIRSVTIDQISAGFSKYAQKTEAVQTIMSATGKSIEEVEKVLGKLNEYTDWTSFNFAEMTTTIGKFTSSGVDLETAERAMEGIGNEASLAGATIQNANHAMYNFAQALATGRVQLMDWKSIENANMATKQFKETIIDTAVELGTLSKAQDGVAKTTKGTVVDYAKFNATLSEGWFTSDVLIKSLEKYADTSTELGKKAFDAAKKAITFGQAIDSVKDAVSTGWMNTFQLIFGDFEEASELWTGFADGLIEVLDKFTSARNELLSGWRDLNGDDGRQILLDGLVEIYQTLSDIAGMVGRVVREFFPPITSERLMSISKGVKEFADGLYEAVHATKVLIGTNNSLFTSGGPEVNLRGNLVEKLEDLKGLLKRGSTGDDVKKLQERLIELGYEADVGVADGIFGPKTQAALKKFQQEAGIAVDGIYGKQSHEAMGKALAKDLGEVETPMERVEQYVYNLTEGLTTLQRIARGFFAVVHVGVNIGRFIINVVKNILSLLSPLGEVVLNLAAVIGDCLVEFDSWITQSGLLDNALTAVQTVLKPFGDWIAKISKSINDFLTTGDKIKSFTDLWNKFKEAVSKTEFGKNLASAFSRIQKTKFFETFSKFLGNIRDKIKNFVTYFKFMVRWVGMGRKPFGVFGKVVDTFRKVVEKLKEVFTNLPNTLVDFGSSIHSFVSSLLEGAKQSPVVQGFIEKIRWFFDLIKTKAGEFIGNVPEYVSKIGDFFKGLVSGDIDVKDVFSNVVSSLDNGVTDLCNKLDASGRLSSAWERTKSFFSKLIEDLKEFSALLWEGITGFFSGGKSGSSTGGATSLFTATDHQQENSELSLFEKLSENLSSFDKLVEWIKSKWESAKQKVMGLFESIKSFFGGGEGGGQKMFDFDAAASGFWEVMGKFNDFLGGFWDDLKENAPIVVNLLEGIVGIFAIKKIGGAFGELKKFLNGYRKDVQPLALSVLEIAGAITLIAVSIEKLGKMKTGELVKGGIMITVVAGVLLGFMLAAKLISGGTEKIGQFGAGILAISGAIAALAALAWAMQVVDWDVLGWGLLKVGTVMAALGVFIFAIQTINKMTGASGFQLVGVMAVAGAVAALAAIAWAMQLIEWDTLGMGLLKMGAIVGALAVFIFAIKAVNNLTGSNGIKILGITAIVGAIAALAALAYAMQLIDWGTLGSSLGKMVAIMAVLSAFILVLSQVQKHSGKLSLKDAKLVFIIAAIGALAILAKMLGKLDSKEFNQGLVNVAKISAVLLGIMAVMSLINKHLSGGSAVMSTVGLVGMVAAMAALGLIVMALGRMDPAQAKQGLIALGVVSACMVVFSGVVALLGSIGIGTVLQGAVGLIAVAAALGTALAIFSTIASGSMDNLGSAFFVLGSGLQDYNSMTSDISWEGMESTLTFLEDFGTTLAKLIANGSTGEEVQTLATNIYRIGGAIGAYGRMVATVDAEKLSLGRKIGNDVAYIAKCIEGIGDAGSVATAIGTIGGAIKLYYDDLSGIDPANGSKAIDSMSTIFGELASAIPSSADISKIEGFAGDGEGGEMTQFAIGVENIGTALQKYGEIADKAPLDKIRATTAILGQFALLSTKLSEGLSVIIGDEGIAITLSTKSGNLSSFALDIELLGNALAAYANNIGGNENFDVTKIEASQTILEKFVGIQSSLEQVGGILDFFSGTKNLGTFASKLSALGKGFAGYVEAISGITNWDNVDKSTGPVEALANAQSKLGKTGGLWSFISGMPDLSSFASDMPKLGEGLAGYANALKGVTVDENVINAAGVVGALSAAQAALTDAGDWSDFLTGSQNLGDLGIGLENFATHLKTADESLSKYDGKKINEAVSVLQAVSKAALEIYQNSFAFTLSELANQINDFYTNIQNDINTEEGMKVVNAMTTLITELPTDMQTSVDTLSGVGQSILDAIATGVTSADATGLVGAIGTAVNSANKSSSSYASGFSTIGANIIAGLVRGIQLHSFEAVSAMENVMRRVKRAAQTVVEVESPSKVFTDIGMYIDQGLANGLTKYANVAEKASAGVMDSTLASTQDLLSNLSAVVNKGIDTNPVITPVIDLTNVTASAGQISGILGSTGIGANLNFRGLTATSLADKYGNTDVVAAINSLNSRMNEMVSAISNMQVVVETGALVGQISTAMDNKLGAMASSKGRLGL